MSKSKRGPAKTRSMALRLIDEQQGYQTAKEEGFKNITETQFHKWCIVDLITQDDIEVIKELPFYKDKESEYYKEFKYFRKAVRERLRVLNGNGKGEEKEPAPAASEKPLLTEEELKPLKSDFNDNGSNTVLEKRPYFLLTDQELAEENARLRSSISDDISGFMALAEFDSTGEPLQAYPESTNQLNAKLEAVKLEAKYRTYKYNRQRDFYFQYSAQSDVIEAEIARRLKEEPGFDPRTQGRYRYVRLSIEELTELYESNLDALKNWQLEMQNDRSEGKIYEFSEMRAIYNAAVAVENARTVLLILSSEQALSGMMKEFSEEDALEEALEEAEEIGREMKGSAGAASSATTAGAERSRASRRGGIIEELRLAAAAEKAQKKKDGGSSNFRGGIIQISAKLCQLMLSFSLPLKWRPS